jgi:hypothetical protein
MADTAQLNVLDKIHEPPAHDQTALQPTRQALRATQLVSKRLHTIAQHSAAIHTGRCRAHQLQVLSNKPVHRMIPAICPCTSALHIGHLSRPGPDRRLEEQRTASRCSRAKQASQHAKCPHGLSATERAASWHMTHSRMASCAAAVSASARAVTGSVGCAPPLLLLSPAGPSAAVLLPAQLEVLDLLLRKTGHHVHGLISCCMTKANQHLSRAGNNHSRSPACIPETSCTGRDPRDMRS